jgi:predicted RNase H-like nuclease (RuvC/YqgF family)
MVEKHNGESLSARSENSVSNGDWKNWVILHGNQKVVAEDVGEVSEAIKMHYKGDKANMFNALSRVTVK